MCPSSSYALTRPDTSRRVELDDTGFIPRSRTETVECKQNGISLSPSVASHASHVTQASTALVPLSQTSTLDDIPSSRHILKPRFWSKADNFLFGQPKAPNLLHRRVNDEKVTLRLGIGSEDNITDMHQYYKNRTKCLTTH